MPIANTAWVRTQLCKLQKRCTQLTVASDKVYQLLAQGRWFSPSNPASSTTKTGRHDIAEILLKVALNTINQIKSHISIFVTNLCQPFLRHMWPDRGNVLIFRQLGQFVTTIIICANEFIHLAFLLKQAFEWR
jgi:hypothetical protein